MAAAGLDLDAAAGEVSATAAQATLESAATASSSKLAGLSVGKLVALSAGGLALAIAVVAALYFLGGSAPPDKPPVTTPVAGDPPPTTPAQPRTFAALDESWLPTDTQLLVSLQWSALSRNAQFGWLQQKLHPAVGQELENICNTLSVKPDRISRATWAVTQVADPTAGDVWLIELAEPIPGEEALLQQAAALDFEYGARRFYQFADAKWTQPFVQLDRRRLLTGDEATLRALSQRETSGVASEALQNLLKHVGVARDLTVLADLEAVRKSQVDLPAAWLQSWGKVGQGWHDLRARAQGVALGLDFGNLLVLQLDLLCNAESAHDVQLSVTELQNAARPWMTEELTSLQERLREGEFNDRVARKISIFLERGLDALDTSETGLEQVDDTLALVWVRARTDEHLSELASAAISSVPAWEARRLAAARVADQAQLQTLIRGLRGYEKSNGAFPQGAAGSTSAPAERRLSWIAQLVPYYETQMGWKDELNFGLPWNVSPNADVARRLLPAVINPAIGPERTADGYPVTHYVGVAGLGADAPLLPMGHERAGLFGYDRRITFGDLAGNSSQTMAIAGVSGKLGSWAAGGKATVRPFTIEPYINGPDGFGSGQADGMFAAMADGSIRFFNKDMDPNVLRQLVVVGGPKPAPEAPVNNANPPDRGNPPLPVDPAHGAANNPPAGNGANNNGANANDANNAAAPPANLGPPPGAEEHRNLRDRLAYPLPSVNFSGQPLDDIVEFLANISGLELEFDLEQLAALGVTKDQHISVKLQSTNIGEALDAALNPFGLTYIPDGEKLRITAAGGTALAFTQEFYDLSGLASTDAEKLALQELLRTFVTPQEWDTAGGSAALGVSGSDLAVSHTSAGQAEVAQFLGRLHLARGLAGADRLQARTWRPVTLATLRQRSQVARGLPVAANFFQPTPLVRIVANLDQKTDTTILIDAPALRAANVDLLAEVDFKVDLKAPASGLEQALGALASKLGLAVRTLDDRTLELTSPAALNAETATEFFPIAEQLKTGQTPEQLQTGIAQLEIPGSENVPPPHVNYDAASRCLIVRGTQPQLFAIEEWLASLIESGQ